MFLKKIAVAIEKKQNSLFTYPKEKQERFLKKLGQPRDEIERGFFQYRCQMKLYGPFLFAILNLGALPVALFHLIRYQKNKCAFEKKIECVFVNNAHPESIVPESLRRRFPDMKIAREENRALDRGGLAFLKKIFSRYPISWMFWLKVIYKLSRYSALIKNHQPEAILCCDEFSFASPVMTGYCREKKVRLINVMHGEKLYFMRDAFACYDEYYVWDSCYAALLIELGAAKEQFRVEVPASLQLKMENPPEKEYDYTYYLAAEDKETLSNIASSLKKLSEKGARVAVRPHPRYTKAEDAKELFCGIELENVKEVSIQASLLRTKNAISLYSTTLNQAYHNGIGVVIDDLSHHKKYQKLSELQYCMLAKEHLLLSELTEEN